MKKFLVKLGLLPPGKLTKKEMYLYLRKKGWRWVLAVFVFYAVRDVAVYIILPYLLFRGIF